MGSSFLISSTCKESGLPAYGKAQTSSTKYSKRDGEYRLQPSHKQARKDKELCNALAIGLLHLSLDTSS